MNSILFNRISMLLYLLPVLGKVILLLYLLCVTYFLMPLKSSSGQFGLKTVFCVGSKPVSLSWVSSQHADPKRPRGGALVKPLVSSLFFFFTHSKNSQAKLREFTHFTTIISSPTKYSWHRSL